MSVFTIVAAAHRLIDLIILLIVIRSFLSFMPSSYNNNIARLIYRFTEPILMPFRDLLANVLPGGGGFYLDLSPLLAIFVLNLFRNVVTRLIFNILR